LKVRRTTSCIDNPTTKVIEGVKKDANRNPSKGTWEYNELVEPSQYLI